MSDPFAPPCPNCKATTVVLERVQLEAVAPAPGGGAPRLYWVRFFACTTCGHRWAAAVLSPGR